MKLKHIAAATLLVFAGLTNVANAAKPDFAYSQSGDPALKPHQVFDDGAKTYLVRGDAVPTNILLVENGQVRPVQYQQQGSMLVVAGLIRGGQELRVVGTTGSVSIRHNTATMAQSLQPAEVVTPKAVILPVAATLAQRESVQDETLPVAIDQGVTLSAPQSERPMFLPAVDRQLKPSAAAQPAPTVEIPFAAGSARLGPRGKAKVKALAMMAGDGKIEVSVYGDPGAPVSQQKDRMLAITRYLAQLGMSRQVEVRPNGEGKVEAGVVLAQAKVSPAQHAVVTFENPSLFRPVSTKVSTVTTTSLPAHEQEVVMPATDVQRLEVALQNAMDAIAKLQDGKVVSEVEAGALRNRATQAYAFAKQRLQEQAKAQQEQERKLANRFSMKAGDDAAASLAAWLAKRNIVLEWKLPAATFEESGAIDGNSAEEVIDRILKQLGLTGRLKGNALTISASQDL